MMDYEGAQANIATNLLLEVHSSTKLFGHLHGKSLLKGKRNTIFFIFR